MNIALHYLCCAIKPLVSDSGTSLCIVAAGPLQSQTADGVCAAFILKGSE